MALAGDEPSVERYEKLRRVGEGTYGVVFQARDRLSGEVVALKRVRTEKERNGGVPVTALREIRLLARLRHRHIVHLRHVVPGTKAGDVFLVFDYIPHDLAALLDRAVACSAPSPFTLSEVKTLALQLLSAVAFLHTRCVLHRDLKLSNLLYTDDGRLLLCDFGMARTVSPRGCAALTPTVVTLWYRAPELLLGCKDYGPAVDTWAVGCILGELLCRKPLFQGSTELAVWKCIVGLLGQPSERIWPAWGSLPRASVLAASDAAQPFNFLKRSFPDLSAAGVDCVNALLTFDPAKRASAEDAARHAFFSERPLPRDQAAMPRFPSLHETGRALVQEQPADSKRARHE